MLLAGLIALPLVRRRWRPPAVLVERLSSPWRAVMALISVNAVILVLVFGLLFVMTRLSLPGTSVIGALVGPVLCYVAWAILGMAMPQQGLLRGGIAAAGMAPFWGVALIGVRWLGEILAQGEPVLGQDDSGVALGAVLVIVIGVAAAMLGSLIVVLCQPLPAHTTDQPTTAPEPAQAHKTET